MIWILLLCFITLAILFFARFISAKAIARSSSVQKSIVIRRIFRVFRIVLIIFFTLALIALILAEIYYVVEVKKDTHHTSWFILRIIFSIIIIVGLTYSAMSLPINGMTMRQFLNKRRSKGYALYLRGFSFDNYVSSMENTVENLDEAYQKSMNFRKPVGSNSNNQTVYFCEKDFYAALRKYLPVYCVGMTKELESPEGIKRIYLEDNSWQEEVSKLIQEARYVFILVNDSESCLWEINKCQEIAKGKTIFIVGDGMVIPRIWLKIGDNMPNELNMGIQNQSFIFNTKHGVKRLKYANNAEGYKSSIKTIMFNIINFDKNESQTDK